MKNEPAFPRAYSVNDFYDYPQEREAQNGMTLCDYFAAKAMQGILVRGGWHDQIVKESFEIADLILKEREK